MKMTVNGEERDCEAATIAELCAAEGIDSSRRGVALALNGRVVPRAEWEHVQLKPRDRVEIVRAFAGG
jgi:sulfur carrier protein